MISALSQHNLVLETDRLILAPMTLKDIDIALELLCDARVMKYVTGHPETEADVRADMPNAVRRGAGGRIGIWSATRKDTGQKIGDGVLLPVPIETDDTEWDTVVADRWPQAQIEVGYLLIPDAWGQGYATEMCARLLRFMFEHSALSKIVATTDPDNVKSHNVLGKNGLRPIGLKRAYAWDDVLWFEITRSDWMRRTRD